MIIARNPEGEIVCSSIIKEADIENELKFEREEGAENLEVVELTEQEKDFYIKTIIAHELRHCIQLHLTASTDVSAQQQIKNNKEEVQNIANIKNNYKKACEKEGVTPNSTILNAPIPQYVLITSHKNY